MQTVMSGTGIFVPEEQVSNDELVIAFNQYVDNFNVAHAADIESGKIAALEHSSSDFIFKASGIERRYVVNKSGLIDPDILAPVLSERTNDEISVLAEIGVKAAEKALEDARLTADNIDAVIVACSNMQRAYPAMAIEIQKFLGINGFAFDMNVACSSATFGINVASDMIKAGSAKRVLMVNPEICSGHLNFRDRDSHFIFGDVCTAVVLERVEDAKGAHFDIRSTRCATRFSRRRREFQSLQTPPRRPQLSGRRSYPSAQIRRRPYRG